MCLGLHTLIQVGAWLILSSLVKTWRCHSCGFPVLSSLNISVDGAGDFIVRMALFQDPNYTYPYEGAAAVLSVESMLYVGAILEIGDTSHFNLVLRNCYATPSGDRADPVRYFIIRNRYRTIWGCRWVRMRFGVKRKMPAFFLPGSRVNRLAAFGKSFPMTCDGHTSFNPERSCLISEPKHSYKIAGQGKEMPILFHFSIFYALDDMFVVQK